MKFQILAKIFCLSLTIALSSAADNDEEQKGACWNNRFNFEACVECARNYLEKDEPSIQSVTVNFIEKMCKEYQNTEITKSSESLSVRAVTFSKSNPEYESWMEKLPHNKTNIPLNHIAIPGSHDSFTYSISSSSGVSPDAEAAFKTLSKIFGFLARSIISKWAVTQHLNFKDQLAAGIRYLDMRVAKNDKDQDFYLVHSLYAKKVSFEIKEINQFLRDHPKEVVFMDFNHLYNMNDKDHQKLIGLLKEVFGDLITPHSDNPPSLADLWQRKKQVLIFYHHHRAYDYADLLWPGFMMPSPWANTADVEKWLNFLTARFNQNRIPTFFHVSQGVLTASTKTILKNPFAGIKKALANKVTPVFVKWLDEHTSGPQKVNMCIVDFVEDFNYIGKVISLNKM